MQFVQIDGANLILRAPPGMDNCQDIVVREEVIEGMKYRFLELALNDDEREAIARGGTMMLGQVGEAWVPVSLSVLDEDKQVVDAG